MKSLFLRTPGLHGTIEGAGEGPSMPIQTFMIDIVAEWIERLHSH